MSRRDRRSPLAPATRAFVAAAILAALGCGRGDRAAVSGTVTLDGAPLDGATILFVPAGGTRGPKAGARIEGGKFSLAAHEGPPFGDLRVEIVKDEANPPPLDDPTVAYKFKGPAPKKNALPKIYNFESTLTARATREGPNEFVFALESKPAAK